MLDEVCQEARNGMNENSIMLSSMIWRFMSIGLGGDDDQAPVFNEMAEDSETSLSAFHVCQVNQPVSSCFIALSDW